ncbi:MAG: SDR family NAD(P)-dependent oxidoreductase [Bacteroidales bacterium]|nr:SDR family NAD(P)-dependent oxidoreductase [Bacteroidales bacterium]HNW72933.1 SDR family oxidoreductase [Bacteroidales bacterium]HPS49668.1 SDR family oxidoreductase [Bacteroidales bacterium]
MEEFLLNGKTVLVTGASSGIGKETALLIHRYGARVILTGRNADRLAAVINRITTQASEHEPSTGKPALSGSCLAIQADLTVESEMDRLISELPNLDGIVHCAGIVGPLPAKFITQPDIDRMFAINYHVPVNLTSKLLRKKKIADHASLVFMSTIATRNPYFGGALYSSSKAALEAYSRTLALEMTPKGIRSNFIMAGLVDTPMIENPSEKNMQEEALQRYLKRYPLGIGKPHDVAGSILFFLSDASRWITGTSLILGGE